MSTWRPWHHVTGVPPQPRSQALQRNWDGVCSRQMNDVSSFDFHQTKTWGTLRLGQMVRKFPRKLPGKHENCFSYFTHDIFQRSTAFWNKQTDVSWFAGIQAWTGFEPMTSSIPVQCSTNWAIKPSGSWSWVRIPFRPGSFSGFNFTTA